MENSRSNGSLSFGLHLFLVGEIEPHWKRNTSIVFYFDASFLCVAYKKGSLNSISTSVDCCQGNNTLQVTLKMMSIQLMIFTSLAIVVLSSPEPEELKAQTPVYGPQPKYEKIEIPHCAKNTTKAWCLEDSEYPQYEIQQALERHYQAGLLDLYKDVLAKTASSVDGLDKLSDEVYLCPSSTGYVQPLRAINVNGKWRTIVNRVESYGIKYTQTARVEECNVVVGTTCSLVPSCYQSKCVQKTVFHRFLVYDANDYTFPFSLEKFRLPGSCGCVVGAFHSL